MHLASAMRNRNSIVLKLLEIFIAGDNLLSTDIQPSDDFALLAAHLLLDCCDWSDIKGQRSF